MKSSRLLVGALAITLIAIATGYVYLPGYLQARAYAEKDQLASSVDPSLVSANNGFALRLLRELRSEDSGKNVFYSPISVSTALAMTLNGAGGVTRTDMARTLGLEGMALSEVNAGYRDLLASLSGADAGVTLSAANSVWADSYFQPNVNKTFTGSLGTYYGAEFFTRSFSDPATVTDINAWVSGKTSGKIDKLVDNLSPMDVMVLLNAIYFKGDWTTQFDASKTAPGTFYLDGGGEVTVDMMHTPEYAIDLGYYEGEGYQVARLPYGREKIAMYIFLPEGNNTLSGMIGSIDLDSFESALTGADSWASELTFTMPKFKLEYGVKRLNNALTNLGMGVAFDPYLADLSGIAKLQGQNLYIGYVDHKAVVEVNEQGTEAAAATSVGIRVTSAPATTPFNVNRPYLFVIRDDRSGSILFLGAMTDPTQVTSP